MVSRMGNTRIFNVSKAFHLLVSHPLSTIYFICLISLSRCQAMPTIQVPRDETPLPSKIKRLFLLGRLFLKGLEELDERAFNEVIPGVRHHVFKPLSCRLLSQVVEQHSGKAFVFARKTHLLMYRVCWPTAGWSNRIFLDMLVPICCGCF